MKVAKKKRIQFGNNRSHALNATKRQWNSNVQKAKVMKNGKLVTVKADARSIRTMRKQTKTQ